MFSTILPLAAAASGVVPGVPVLDPGPTCSSTPVPIIDSETLTQSPSPSWNITFNRCCTNRPPGFLGHASDSSFIKPPDKRRWAESTDDESNSSWLTQSSKKRTRPLEKQLDQPIAGNSDRITPTNNRKIFASQENKNSIDRTTRQNKSGNVILICNVHKDLLNPSSFAKMLQKTFPNVNPKYARPLRTELSGFLVALQSSEDLNSIMNKACSVQSNFGPLAIIRKPLEKQDSTYLLCIGFPVTEEISQLTEELKNNGLIPSGSARIRDKEGNLTKLVRIQFKNPIHAASLIQEGFKFCNLFRLKFIKSNYIERTPQCFKCLKPGHWASSCKENPKCLLCGKTDHVAKNCPLKNQPAQCINCNNQHIVLYKGCPMIKKCALELKKSKTLQIPKINQQTARNPTAKESRTEFLYREQDFPKLKSNKPQIQEPQTVIMNSEPNNINALSCAILELLIRTNNNSNNSDLALAHLTAQAFNRFLKTTLNGTELINLLKKSNSPSLSKACKIISLNDDDSTY